MRAPRDVLYNFHWVVPGEAARAAQAWAGRLGPFLDRNGIRAMINLRGPNPSYGWWRSEKRVTAARGIAHIDVVLDSRHLPTREMLADLLAAFDAAPKPFLVKCSGGQDRTSLAAALYILHRKGWAALPEAQAQFASWPYLHLPKAEQRWLKLFVVFAAEQAKGRPLAQWIGADYTPHSLAAWPFTSSHAASECGV